MLHSSKHRQQEALGSLSSSSSTNNVLWPRLVSVGVQLAQQQQQQQPGASDDFEAGFGSGYQLPPQGKKQQ